MEINEIKKQALKEILQTIVVPVAAWLAFFALVYNLIKSPIPRELIFPLSGPVMLVLYYFSGPIQSGIYLGFLTVVGLGGILLAADGGMRWVFLFETIWLWAFFLMIELYQQNYIAERNHRKEEEEVSETRLALLGSTIESTQKRRDSLIQRISNYQLLGRIVQIAGSTIHEERILPMIVRLAAKFIARGTWDVKLDDTDNAFVEYVKNNKVPLIIENLSTDNRFYSKRARFSSMIAVPVEVNGEFHGIIKGISSRTDEFDEGDLRLLSVLGGLASISLTNARLYQRLQELSITDGLTGLYVQRYFKERLSEELQRSKSHNLALSVALIDVDHFKKFNDNYGHSSGDAVLRQVAHLLRRRLRETDFLCRYGGEEFSLIMLQTCGQEAGVICEEIRKSIESERFYLPIESFQPVCARLAVSIGIAEFSRADQTENELIELADAALYRAKKNGRNCVVLEQQKQ